MYFPFKKISDRAINPYIKKVTPLPPCYSTKNTPSYLETMPQLIPTELEDGTIIYFQVEESANISSGNNRHFGISDDTKTAAKDKAIQSFQAMQNLVRGYTVNTLNAFRNLSTIEVSEVTLEFGVSLDAEAGVPFIASGGTSSNLKITVKCAFPKQKEIASPK